MESVKVITKFDFRTLKYCNLYLLKYKRKSYIISYIFAGITFALSIYTFISNQPIFGIAFIALGLLMIVQAFTLEKKLDQNLTRFFFNKSVNQQEIEINDEKIIITKSLDKDNPVEYDWAYITEIHQIPQFYMLFIGKNQAPLIIDRSDEALVSGTKEQLDQLIKDKTVMKPFKVIDKDIVKIPITYVHQYVEEPNKEVVEAEVVENKDVKGEVAEVVENKNKEKSADLEKVEEINPDAVKTGDESEGYLERKE